MPLSLQFHLGEVVSLFNFSFQQPESLRLCMRSPRREWPSPSPAPAPRVPPLFADATTATRVHRARDGNGAAAARTWSLGPWCPGNSLTRGRIDPTRARLWTAITTRQEEWWVFRWPLWDIFLFELISTRLILFSSIHSLLMITCFWSVSATDSLGAVRSKLAGGLSPTSELLATTWRTSTTARRRWWWKNTVSPVDGWRPWDPSTTTSSPQQSEIWFIMKPHPISVTPIRRRVPSVPEIGSATWHRTV